MRLELTDCMFPKLTFFKVYGGNVQLVCLSLVGGRVRRLSALHASGIGLRLTVHFHQMFLGEQVVQIALHR